MSTTYTTNSGIPKPSYRDRNHHVALNAALDLLDTFGGAGPLAVQTAEKPSASRNVKVAAGSYVRRDGTLVAYAGSAGFTVTASGTRYLYLTDAGVLTDGTAWPAANHVRLAVVVTGTSTVTSITDARVAWMSSGAGATMAGLDERMVGVIFAGTADSSAVVNSNTLTDVTPTGVGTLSIPANWLAAGKCLRVRCDYVASSSSIDDVLKPALTIGAQTFQSSGGVTIKTGASNVCVSAMFDITCRGTGASASCVGTTLVQAGSNSDVWATPTLQTLTVDNSGAVTIAPKVQWGTANAGATATLKNFTVEILN